VENSPHIGAGLPSSQKVWKACYLIFILRNKPPPLYLSVALPT